MKPVFGTEQESYVELESLFSTEDWTLPTEHPLLWTIEEQAHAEACCLAFAAEYIYDWNGKQALIRCGVEAKQANALAKVYLAHPLVQRCIRAAIQNFKEQQLATQDAALAFIYRDASDFSPYANPLARVNAQKTLARYLQMDLTPAERAPGSGINVNNHGGVMVVEKLSSVDEWEQETTTQQEQLIENASERA